MGQSVPSVQGTSKSHEEPAKNTYCNAHAWQGDPRCICCGWDCCGPSGPDCQPWLGAAMGGFLGSWDECSSAFHFCSCFRLGLGGWAVLIISCVRPLAGAWVVRLPQEPKALSSINLDPSVSPKLHESQIPKAHLRSAPPQFFCSRPRIASPKKNMKQLLGAHAQAYRSLRANLEPSRSQCSYHHGLPKITDSSSRGMYLSSLCPKSCTQTPNLQPSPIPSLKALQHLTPRRPGRVGGMPRDGKVKKSKSRRGLDGHPRSSTQMEAASDKRSSSFAFLGPPRQAESSFKV